MKTNLICFRSKSNFLPAEENWAELTAWNKKGNKFNLINYMIINSIKFHFTHNFFLIFFNKLYTGSLRLHPWRGQSVIEINRQPEPFRGHSAPWALFAARYCLLYARYCILSVDWIWRKHVRDIWHSSEMGIQYMARR